MIGFEDPRVVSDTLLVFLEELISNFEPDNVFPISRDEFLAGAVRQLIENKLLEFDELEALGCQIDHNVVLIASNFIARLEKYGGLSAALAAKDDVQIPVERQAELLGFEKIPVELRSFVFRSGVAGVNGIKGSASDRAYFDMLALGFGDGVAELAHLTVDVGDGVPSRGKLVQVQRQTYLAV